MSIGKKYCIDKKHWIQDSTTVTCETLKYKWIHWKYIHESVYITMSNTKTFVYIIIAHDFRMSSMT